jgi:hypothetical protein
MRKIAFLSMFAACLLAAMNAEAGWGNRAARMAHVHTQQHPWNGTYAYTPNGGPVALIVPPTADSMASWSWGVSQSEMRPLYHQFGRGYQPGMMGGSGSPYHFTPAWPSHTDQFGVYPVRGPW